MESTLKRTETFIKSQDGLLATMRDTINKAQLAQWDLEELEQAKNWYDNKDFAGIGLTDYKEQELPELINAARMKLKLALVDYATIGHELCSGMLAFNGIETQSLTLSTAE